MNTARLAITGIVLTCVSAAAAQGPAQKSLPDPDGQVIRSEQQTFRIEVLARGLETPWGIAFLPDGRILVTERPGRLRVVADGKLLPEPVKGTPAVWEKQDGGLLDVEVHPDHARNGWIYLSYSEILPGSAAPSAQLDPPTMTVIVRGRVNERNEWIDQQVLFRAPAAIYNSTNVHYGSRFVFDRSHHLFFSLGDKGALAAAQDLSQPAGKIHRINDDGSTPKDNPFVQRAGALPTIWSYGHRNPQGLAWDPVTGQLWSSEHGPNGGDEINVIEPGRNYGWGVITMGKQPGITRSEAPGMEQPVVHYTPTIAPTGMTFYSGEKYPNWRNHLFVAALAGQQLRRLETKGDAVTRQEVVLKGFGRVRDVVAGPDGLLYVLLQRPGQIVSQSTPGVLARLVPVAR